MSPEFRPVRAFLSYVREEGGFVAQVAKRLTQARVVVDRHAFAPGAPFPEAIRAALAGGNMAVVFASRQSISSTWVQFEVSEAEIRRLQGDLRRLLVLTIDSPESRRLLPAWAQTALVTHAPTAAMAADVIASQIVAFEAGARPSTLFLGRDRNMLQLRSALIPAMGLEPPRVLVLHGLQGIGRRTLARHAVAAHLAAELAPVVVLAPNAALDWLHLELVSRVVEFANQGELQGRLAAFAEKSDLEKGRELADLIVAMSGGHYVPAVVDGGGLLMDEDGRWTDAVQSMLRTIGQSERLHLVIATARTPRPLGEAHIAVESVDPIDHESTRILITQGLRLAELNAEPGDVARLAPWVAGYPPAALLLIDAIRQYGVNAVVSDVPSLKDLTQKVFSPLLDKLKLEPIDREFLRLLTPFGELPIQVLARLVSKPEDEAAAAAKRLADVHLIVPGEVGVALSAPLRQSVSQRYGEPTADESRRIAEVLRELFWPPGTTDTVLPPIVEAVSVAIGRAGDVRAELQDLGVYDLPSVLVRMANESYDSRNWDKALYYAQKALAKGERADALELAFKANVRLDRWQDAEDVLARINRRGSIRRHHLRGFMEWKRGQLAAAVTSFQAGLAAGDRSLLLRHNLAYCLYLLNKPKEARVVIEAMPARASSRNRFFLDLVAQVLIRLRQIDEARPIIDDMKRYGFEADYWHRLAHILMIEGKYDEAFEAATKAVELGPFRNEARGLQIEALVALGRLDEALAQMSRLVLRSERDKDLFERLSSKIWLRRGDLNRAEAHWRNVRRQDDYDSKTLRIEILSARLAGRNLAPPVKTELEVERLRLTSSRDELPDASFERLLDDGP